MQSTAVLQKMYCKMLSSQLAAQEEKKLARKWEKLVGDGLPRLLTGDEFYHSVLTWVTPEESLSVTFLILLMVIP